EQHSIHGTHDHCSGVRLYEVAPGTPGSRTFPSGSVISSSKPPGSPFVRGATTAFTLSPALIIFDRQPARCIMLIRPLEPGNGALQIERFCVIEHRKRMMRKQRACQENS